MAAMTYDFVAASNVVYNTCGSTNPAFHINKYGFDSLRVVRRSHTLKH